MRTWLDTFDNLAGHGEDRPNDAIAPTLKEVGVLLKEQRYVEALETALHHLHWKMSDRQHAWLLYALARAAIGADELSLVPSSMERALDIAAVRNDSGVTAQVLTLRARALRNLGDYPRALKDYTQCLDLLYELVNRKARRSRGALEQSADVDMELEALIGLAIIHFSRGRHELCEALLERAYLLYTLAPGAPDPRPELGQILWMKALSARWLGQPWRALERIDAAITILHTSEGLASAGRVFAVSADIALDCAQHPNAEAAHQVRHGEARLLDRAEQHARLAFDICRQTKDTPGQELANLATVRHSRIVGRNENRLAVLEGMIEAAFAYEDIPLLIQAQSALADELVYLGRQAVARHVYHRTLQIADHSEMPVMGYWARQALEALSNEDE